MSFAKLQSSTTVQCSETQKLIRLHRWLDTLVNSQSEKSRLIESFMAMAGSMLPPNLKEDVRANVLAGFKTTLENMDIVTREEIEVQETVLQRAVEKISELEARVLELESNSE
ncbi:MAG: accessory factor UbiK family protein [Gammaproteobacteria bacterium]|nr:accessory factor UbiK family protein [Gammaproteobacteria bacterium]